MFKDTQSLQSFILWCRDQHIKSVSIGDVKVEFSDYAFIEKISQSLDAPLKTEEKNTSKTLTDTLPSEDDEDLLFWSAKS